MECEVKILEVNEQQLLQKLKSLGAKLTFVGDLESHYYDLPDESLRNSQKMLRLRKEGNACKLTLKTLKSNSEVKINDEKEVIVANFERANAILLGLGFVEFAKDSRRRKTFNLGTAKVELNLYKNIPPFLEIEAETKEHVKKAVELLGFSMKETKTWTGKDVLKHYGKA